MIMKDSVTVDASGLSMTRDGYLSGEAKVSRAGNVQQYLGAELGLTGDDAGKVYGVYRDPSVVFDEKSMMSLAGRPVTRGHPPVGVSAENWKDLSVGQMGGVIKRDGEHVVASMAIMDSSAAHEVMSGARSLSAGYTVSLTKDEGVSPSGEPYQYRQSGDLRFNHVAYLPDNNPRAGNTRIGDSWGTAPVADNQTGATPKKPEEGGHMADSTKSVILGDAVVQVAVTDAALIEQFKKDSAKALTDAKAEHKTAIEAKDEEIGTLKADLAAANAAAVIDVDKLVADRSALVTQVKVIDAKIDPAGKTDAELRKAAVASRLGDEMVADAGESEINGMFKAIAKDAKPADPVRDAFSRGTHVNMGDQEAKMNDALKKADEDLNAWRYAQGGNQ